MNTLCDCGETNSDNFYNKRNTICKKCYSKRRTNIKKINKQKSIEYLGGCCSNCGYKKSISALEFHHINPKIKDINFKNILYKDFEQIKIELDKCVLLCANCHREEHDRIRSENIEV